MPYDQTIKCDGRCCIVHPMWPKKDGTGCLYLENTNCLIMEGKVEMPTEPSPAQPNLTPEETFKKCCFNWPHNMEGRRTGKCCWQLVDG